MHKVSHIPFEILDGSSEGGGTLVYEDALKRTGKSQVLKNIKIIASDCINRKDLAGWLVWGFTSL